MFRSSLLSSRISSPEHIPVVSPMSFCRLVSDCVARDRDWYVVERLNTRALSNLSTSSSNTNGLYFVRPRSVNIIRSGLHSQLILVLWSKFAFFFNIFDTIVPCDSEENSVVAQTSLVRLSRVLITNMESIFYLIRVCALCFYLEAGAWRSR